jgi:hypothetical protein
MRGERIAPGLGRYANRAHTPRNRCVPSRPLASGHATLATKPATQGKPDEALQVCRRIVDKCKTRLAKDPATRKAGMT